MPLIGNRTHPLRPVRQEHRPLVEYAEWEPPLRWHAMDDAFDRIAFEVAHLPRALSVGHKKRARIIARELVRKARQKAP